MTEEIKDSKPNRNIHTSYVGTFKVDSFSIDENGVASAVLETRTGEKVVKGYNDNAKTLEDAAKSDGEIIVRGVLLGGSKNPHMGVYATGPERITGVVNKVRDNFSSCEEDGRQPYLNAWVGVERGGHRIFRAVVAFGNDALALKDMKEGDRLNAPGRAVHEKREVNGEEKWVEMYRITGVGTFEPADELVVEADDPPPPSPSP